MIEAGRVTTEVVDKSARRVVELAQKTSRFEDPVEKPEYSVLDPERLTFIANMAAEGMVLLKNDNDTLPLPRPSVGCPFSVAVVGQHAINPSIGGGGSAKVLSQRIVSPLEGLEALGVECRYSPGVPVYGALPHAKPDTISPVLLRWFNGPKVEEAAKVHEQTIATPEYMIKEAWPSFLESDYCTSMTFDLTPSISGEHTFSVITTGRAVVLVNGIEVFERKQETNLLPESFYFYKAKIGRQFTLAMNGGEKYKVEMRSWATEREILAALSGTMFQGASLRFKEYLDVIQAIQDAGQVAAAADAAVVMVGTTNEIESEGYDRETMDLTSEQYDLIAAVAAKNPRTVVVNFSGSPVTVSPFIDRVPAFLQAWFAGQEVGHAIARVLLGDVNPSGRLPMSWPKRNEDNPAFGNFPCDVDDVLRYEEGLKIGYRFYDTEEAPDPQFHFGAGLSYTNFEITGDLRVTGPVSPQNNWEQIKVSVDCDVTNVGQRGGKQVVQLYVAAAVSPSSSQQPRPVKELKAYQKVFVGPGQTETVTLELDKYAFSFFDVRAGQWKLQGGEYAVHACFSSAEILRSAKVMVPQSHHWSGI
jgi:beta-glucosidase